MTEKAKKSSYYETHDIRLKHSKSIWRKFDSWRISEGCTTRVEGIKLAMRLIIGREAK